jgi:hypothetical protein
VANGLDGRVRGEVVYADTVSFFTGWFTVRLISALPRHATPCSLSDDYIYSSMFPAVLYPGRVLVQEGVVFEESKQLEASNHFGGPGLFRILIIFVYRPEAH